MEFWTLTTSPLGRAGRIAREAEERGWDGLVVVDSQNLSGDSWVSLTAMTLATGRLRLGTGVTNPVTRHPAVTAGAAASIQRLSGGRMVLGIGRGDSALAHVGRAPARVGYFIAYLGALRSYLHGEAVDFTRLPFGDEAAPEVATLGLADTPAASALEWLNERDARVPLEVAATGPRVIDAAATFADRVMFALGADPARLEWGVERARAAARRAGREVALGAYINMACEPDLDLGRRLVQGGLSTFARFSVMHGHVRGTASEEQRSVLNRLHDEYNMKAHTRADSPQAALLTPEFIDSYAIVGDPEHCTARLQAIRALGIDKVTVIGPGREAEARLLERVVPAFRGDT